MDYRCKKCNKGISGEQSRCGSGFCQECIVALEAGYMQGMNVVGVICEKIRASHLCICTLFDLPTSCPIEGDDWRSIATKVEIVVNGRRRYCYGGAVHCTKCGFEVSGFDGKRCPKCEAKKLGITMDEWYKRNEASKGE